MSRGCSELRWHPPHSTLLALSRRGALLLGMALLIILLPRGAAGADVRQQEIPDGYQMSAENELFRLYIDPATLAFKLLDRRSGYLWHSGIDALLENDRLNTSWRAFARSGISIEYFDSRAANKRASITNAEHTLDVIPVDQGISAHLTFLELGISFTVIVQLETDGVRVEVPGASIREENPDFRLGKIYFYPFLGATRGSSTPGYLFLPDGSGSLIRFADATKARNMFYGRYYGVDLGMLAQQPYDPRIIAPAPISLPVFGMVHGENAHAFIAVIERGAGYSELQAHPAGIITNFNFAYNAFIYSETYFQATNRSGAGVTIVQNQRNAFDAVLHYRFLTGEAATLVGMAHSYQRYLLDRGLLRRNDTSNPNIGMRLEFLGGDKEKILLWNRFIPMTTISQMRAILDALQIPHAEVIYYGWQPFGATAMPPTVLTLEGGLGSIDELRALAAEVESAGGHFALYLAPQEALWNEPGYSPRGDLALAITNTTIWGYNRYASYFFQIDALRQRYSALSEDIAARLPAGLALDGIGWMLYTDYRERQPFNREDAIRAYRDLLAETPLRLSFYRPNDYLFSLTSAYYDIPLSDNGYVFTSETVPFLPIVLAGYIPYYGTALNFSSNRQNDLLRHVEFGAYPAYFLTHEATANMLSTPSNWIYTSSYVQWGEQIRATYRWMNALLSPVRGQEIIGHERLAEGVYATTYARGGRIIVNYTDQPFVSGAITVEAKNAAFVEGKP